MTHQFLSPPMQDVLLALAAGAELVRRADLGAATLSVEGEAEPRRINALTLHGLGKRGMVRSTWTGRIAGGALIYKITLAGRRVAEELEGIEGSNDDGE